MSGERNNPAGGHNGRPRVAGTIRAFVKKYQVFRKHDDTKHDDTTYWTKRTFYAACVYSFLTLIIAISGIWGVIVTRQSFTAVQRAFITVDSLEIIPEAFPGQSQVVGWDFNPIVVNSGNTPTQNLYWTITLAAEQLTDRPAGLAPNIPVNFISLGDIAAHKNMRQDILGPRSTVTNFTSLNGFGVSAGKQPEPAVYFVWGAFEYGDVFSPNAKHITEFCFVVSRAITPLDHGHPPYQKCAKHNCADDECKAP